jgi:hypothetical protein
VILRVTSCHYATFCDTLSFTNVWSYFSFPLVLLHHTKNEPCEFSLMDNGHECGRTEKVTRCDCVSEWVTPISSIRIVFSFAININRLLRVLILDFFFSTELRKISHVKKLDILSMHKFLWHSNGYSFYLFCFCYFMMNYCVFFFVNIINHYGVIFFFSSIVLRNYLPTKALNKYLQNLRNVHCSKKMF